jgi:hypothetical protein
VEPLLLFITRRVSTPALAGRTGFKRGLHADRMRVKKHEC